MSSNTEVNLHGPVQQIEKGQPVEFVYDGRINFGICTKPAIAGLEVEIECPRYGIVKSWQILSYGWTGWLPEELVKIWEKYNPTSPEEVYEFE